MITPYQLRAARALLDLSKTDLAEKASVTREQLVSAETNPDQRETAVFDAIESALVAAGIAFIADGEDGGGPGVRLKHAIGVEAGIRPEDLNAANDD